MRRLAVNILYGVANVICVVAERLTPLDKPPEMRLWDTVCKQDRPIADAATYDLAPLMEPPSELPPRHGFPWFGEQV